MTTDSVGCVGDTILLASGKYFNVFDPNLDDIDLHSIALGLTHTRRFSGQTKRIYSVAEHCVFATALYLTDCLKANTPFERMQAQAILLHDGSEAFMGDMSKPHKNKLPDFVAAENKLQSAIFERFGIHEESTFAIVKKYDLQMLKAEKMHFWPQNKDAWNGFENIESRVVGIAMEYDEREIYHDLWAWLAWLVLNSTNTNGYTDNERQNYSDGLQKNLS